ncbi:MAG TPA: NAD(P)H-dependent oxidoreductase subunit E [Actinomycetota bacterium]|nr:NAD(P)H-dependent oxidoreductase subunit E [Actinomycetota bacterium]
MSATPTDEERAAVDEVLGPPGTGWRGGERSALDGHVSRGGREVRERRDLLLPALHALQSRVGWISEGGLTYVSQRLTVPPAEAYGVASFYAMFSTEPRPRSVVHVCDDIACKVAGAEELVALMDEAAAKMPIGVVRSPCLGQCDRAPAVLVQRAGPRDDITIAPATATVALEEARGPDVDVPSTHRTSSGSPRVSQPSQGLRLLRRVGIVDPTSLDDYRAHGGYEALRRAVELGPDGVIAELKDAKLLGRGGAAFPTGVKWEAVARQPVRPHYFVCNADESEPGTFKDRVLMEGDPFAVIESLTIAGYATGSEIGYLYVRGEYPHATAMIEGAMAQARARGYLGDDVMGQGVAFDVEVRRGAGAYICGEETALFNSIEGKRGEPRNKPPFPVERGLFGKPTGINNVETLVNVLEILTLGGLEYAKLGTPDSTGTRLFCLSGSIRTPGVYEVEHGVALRDLLELADGVPEGRSLRAVLLGGAAGTFVGPEDLDLPLTFEDAKAAGTTLGSGVVMPFDDTVDLEEIVLRIAAFFRDESCGQCVPCRVGTVRQEEALHRLVRDRPMGSRRDELALIGDLGRVMRDASICGLGQLASNAVESAVERLDLFDGGGKR